MLEGVDSANVVLVTNVGQGFGRAIALSFGQADYDVVCADNDVDLASKTAAEIEELGGQAIPVQVDITTQLDVTSAFDKVYEIFGDLSGVIHVASAESLSAFDDVSEGELAELLNENLRSTFLLLKATARFLEEGYFVLVLPPISADEPHMLAVRAAMTEMVRGFEKKHPHVRVNLVTPSRSASDPKHDAPLVKTVRYLASSASEGISGHDIKVTLPAPPKILESLLPEVQAALDTTVRQADLEASVYGDEDEDEEVEENMEKV
jgi:NAD(P)-dependent dehydrogenase (short-subunit alcohol dehydrogenase family)